MRQIVIEKSGKHTHMLIMIGHGYVTVVRGHAYDGWFAIDPTTYEFYPHVDADALTIAEARGLVGC